mmetsp:Transcript_60672/g.140074  ORF Transcript_60672/g.140074 Transcript_60672/m.140074 type:complete len:251 (+) Transcript_60672:33-785(+)
MGNTSCIVGRDHEPVGCCVVREVASPRSVAAQDARRYTEMAMLVNQVLAQQDSSRAEGSAGASAPAASEISLLREQLAGTQQELLELRDAYQKLADAGKDVETADEPLTDQENDNGNSPAKRRNPQPASSGDAARQMKLLATKVRGLERQIQGTVQGERPRTNPKLSLARARVGTLSSARVSGKVRKATESTTVPLHAEDQILKEMEAGDQGGLFPKVFAGLSEMLGDITGSAAEEERPRWPATSPGALL